MFHIIALISLLSFLNKATVLNARPNRTEDHSSSAPPNKSDQIWLYDNLNSTKPQWLCSAVSQRPAPLILNSSQTLDVHLKCKRIQGSEIDETTTEPLTEDRQKTITPELQTQQDEQEKTCMSDFRRTFRIGASTGGGLVFIIVMIVSILCCCAKRQKKTNLTDRLEDNKPKCAVTNADELISLNNETTQPLCENDHSNAADTNDSSSNDVVVEVEDNTEESDYLTPVDSQTEIKIFPKRDHENGANQKRSEAPIYTHPLSKNSRLLLPSLTPPPANVGKKNGENGAEEQATVPSTESEKSTFQTRNSGKNRYQDLKYPKYENWVHNKGTYASLLKENDQNDNQSRTRVPSEVAYVNLPKRS